MFLPVPIAVFFLIVVPTLAFVSNYRYKHLRRNIVSVMKANAVAIFIIHKHNLTEEFHEQLGDVTVEVIEL